MPSNTKFPHNPYGMSSSYSRSEVQIDGMKVKFDKVADLVPAELTMKAAAQTVRAMTTLVFDPAKVFEVAYTSPGNETLSMVVARNYMGMAPEEIAKAIAFHQERLQLGETLLKPGQVINVYLMASSDPVVVRAAEVLTDAEIESLATTAYTAWYEANWSAIDSLKNILWWPETAEEPANSIFNESLMGIFKSLVEVVKDSLPAPHKYMVEFVTATFENTIKGVFDNVVEKPSQKNGQEAFEYIQNLLFSLRRFHQNLPMIVAKFRTDFRIKTDPMEAAGVSKFDISDHLRATLESMNRVFRQSFVYEVELLAKLFSTVYKDAYLSVELNGNPGGGDLSYAGLRGVPEKSRVLLNKEYNRLANQLGWKYMTFYQMGLPFQVRLLSPKGSIKCSTALHLLADQYPMEGYLRNRAQDIPRVLYYHNTKLYKMEGKYGTPLTYHLPYPVRFTVS